MICNKDNILRNLDSTCVEGSWRVSQQFLFVMNAS